MVPGTKEKHTLRVFENRGLKMEEMAGGWRRLHNEKLHNMYTSPNQGG
jgi:hypothetical protein